jgi:hypothetical protein
MLGVEASMKRMLVLFVVLFLLLLAQPVLACIPVEPGQRTSMTMPDVGKTPPPAAPIPIPYPNRWR